MHICALLHRSDRIRSISAHSYKEQIDRVEKQCTVTGNCFSRNHISDYLLSGRHVSRMYILVTIACGRLRPARPPAHIRVRLQGSGGSGDKSVYCYKGSESLRRSRRTLPLKVRPSRQHVCVQLQGSDWSGEKTAHGYKDSASCAAAAQPTWPQLPLGPVDTKLNTVTRNRGTSNFTCAQVTRIR